MRCTPSPRRPPAAPNTRPRPAPVAPSQARAQEGRAQWWYRRARAGGRCGLCGATVAADAVEDRLVALRRAMGALRGDPEPKPAPPPHPRTRERWGNLHLITPTGNAANARAPRRVCACADLRGGMAGRQRGWRSGTLRRGSARSTASSLASRRSLLFPPRTNRTRRVHSSVPTGRTARRRARRAVRRATETARGGPAGGASGGGGRRGGGGGMGARNPSPAPPRHRMRRRGAAPPARAPAVACVFPLRLSAPRALTAWWWRRRGRSGTAPLERRAAAPPRGPPSSGRTRARLARRCARRGLRAALVSRARPACAPAHRAAARRPRQAAGIARPCLHAPATHSPPLPY